jgi:hypothetical protein
LRKHDVAKDVDWIYLAQEINQWRTLLKTVMSLRVEYCVPLGNVAAALEGHDVLTFNVIELREMKTFRLAAFGVIIIRRVWTGR